jgi:hypothetical protein
VEQLRRERPFCPSHIVEGGGDGSEVGQIEEPERERPVGPSHVVDGGGDAQKFKVTQQSVNHWLVQIETPQVELPTMIRKRELTKQLEDLDHYLTLDRRFSGLLCEIKRTRPGRQRNKILELFWMRIYNGYSFDETDGLTTRSLALNDCLSAFDEFHELSAPPEDQDTSMRGRALNNQVRRSSAVSGMGVLALE